MQERISQLIEQLNHGLVNKEEPIKLALLALLSGENLLLIGPPGTAKSEISRRISQTIKDSNEFEYLLTKFSTPEEIFGPLSIKELKEGVYKRKTEGYLPQAHVAFLDEIFKANSAILNSLLTVMNERVFHNGNQREQANLVTLIGASNELPLDEEQLAALYDRFLLRMHVGYVPESDVEALFHLPGDGLPLDDDLKFSLDDIQEVRKEARKVHIPEEIIQLIKGIRDRFNKTFEEDSDEEISDRRLVKIQGILRISAYINGRNEVNRSDLLLLQHCLWNNPENIKAVSDIILGSVTSGADENVLPAVGPNESEKAYINHILDHDNKDIKVIALRHIRMGESIQKNHIGSVDPFSDESDVEAAIPGFKSGHRSGAELLINALEGAEVQTDIKKGQEIPKTPAIKNEERKISQIPGPRAGLRFRALLPERLIFLRDFNKGDKIRLADMGVITGTWFDPENIEWDDVDVVNENSLKSTNYRAREFSGRTLREPAQKGQEIQEFLFNSKEESNKRALDARTFRGKLRSEIEDNVWI